MAEDWLGPSATFIPNRKIVRGERGNARHLYFQVRGPYSDAQHTRAKYLTSECC